MSDDKKTEVPLQTPMEVLLAEIFRTQLYGVAQEFVAKQMREDTEIRAAVSDMVRKATKEVLEGDSFSQFIAKLLEQALSKVSY